MGNLRTIRTGGPRGLLGALALSALSVLVAACGSGGTPRADSQTPRADSQTPRAAAVANEFEPAAASFVSPSQGWVLGSGSGCHSCAQLLVTSDGGARWTALPAPPAPLGYYSQQSVAVTDVVFAGSSDGFLFGPGLLATHDGGRSWVRQPLPPVLTVGTGGGYVYALTQREQAGPVALWRSAAGTSRWQRLTLPAGAAPLPGTADPGMGLSVEGRTLVLLQTGFTGPGVSPGQTGRLWVSGDAGTRWQARPVPCTASDGGAAVAAIALGHPDAWLVDCFDNMQSSQQMDTRHHLYGTVNAGRTWIRLPDPTRHNAPVLLADNGAGHAFLATQGGLGDTLSGTMNGGRNWGIVLRDGASFFGWADLDFVSTSVGFVVGPTHYEPGHLYRTQDAGRTWQVMRL